MRGSSDPRWSDQALVHVLGGICLVGLWTLPIDHWMETGSISASDTVLRAVVTVAAGLLLREIGTLRARVEAWRHDPTESGDGPAEPAMTPEVDATPVAPDGESAAALRSVLEDREALLTRVLRESVEGFTQLSRVAGANAEQRDLAEQFRLRLTSIAALTRATSEVLEAETSSVDLRTLLEGAVRSGVARRSGVDAALLVEPEADTTVRTVVDRCSDVVAAAVACVGSRAERVVVRADVVDSEYLNIDVVADGDVAEAFDEDLFEFDTRSTGGASVELALAARSWEARGGSVGIVPSAEGNGLRISGVFVPGDLGPAVEPERVLARTRVLLVSDFSALRLGATQIFRAWRASIVAVPEIEAARSSLRAAASAGDPFRLLVFEGIDPEVVAPLLSDEELGRPVGIALGPGRIPGVRSVATPLVRRELHRAAVAALTDEAPASTEVPVEPASAIDDVVIDTVRHLEAAGAVDEPATTTQGTVLVVDDNPVNRRVAGLIVQRAGFDLVTATHGLEAIERLEEIDGPLVLLMDVNMPVLDGLEATARIRARDDERSMVPIVAMTASTGPDDERRCREVGMDDAVSKPVRAEDLVAVITHWLTEGRSDYERPATAAFDPDATLEMLESAGLDELRSLAGDDASILDELVQAFVDAAVEHVETIRAAASAGDRAKLASSAHGLKGSSATMGAMRLSDLAARLETTAREEGAAIEHGWADAIAREFDVVRSALNEALSASPATRTPLP